LVVALGGGLACARASDLSHHPAALRLSGVFF
jgi:hypothetical protein